MDPHAAGFTSHGSTREDALFAGDYPRIERKITIASGASHIRGELLGEITLGDATAAAKAGGNTGNGTISAVTLAAGAKAGVYTVRFTAATVFTVEDPDGLVLGVNGATGVAWADDLGFTITVGGTPFAAADGFDITVAAGSGKYALALAAATNGSAAPKTVLAHDVDATSGDVEAIAYFAGNFNSAAMTFGTGITAASASPGLRDLNIYI